MTTHKASLAFYTGIPHRRNNRTPFSKWCLRQWKKHLVAMDVTRQCRRLVWRRRGMAWLEGYVSLKADHQETLEKSLSLAVEWAPGWKFAPIRKVDFLQKEVSLFITHRLEVKYITATATLTLVKPGWLGRGKVSAISYLGHVIYLQKYLPKQERKRQNKLTALGKIFDTGILTFYTAGFHRLHNHYLWFTSLCIRRGPRTLLNSRRKLSCEKQPWEELT